MQTTAQEARSVRLGSIILQVAGQNMGILTEAQLNVEYVKIQIIGHNAKLPPRKKPTNVTITANMYEVYPDSLAKLDGFGDVASVAGTPVNQTGEVLTGWTVGQPIKLANKNGDNTEVSSIVVDVDGSPITLGTDYNVFVLNGYTYIDPITAQTGTIDVDYTYTPATMKTYTIRDVVKTLQTQEITMINTDENGKEFRIVMPAGSPVGNLEMAFQADEETGEALNIPITFEANADENNVLVRIEDEQVV